jgi:uncharacterized protein YceH (UPF0502 family)
MQLLSGDAPPAVDVARSPSRGTDSSADDRLSHMENEVAELRREVTEIHQQLAAFRKQFE